MIADNFTSMLHHCNVDRLWAYWQAMKPQEAIFQRTYRGGARYSTPRGTTISSTSPLNPFYRNGQEFHTTQSVASIKLFGYAYSGLENRSWSPEALRANATALVNRLYGDNRQSRVMRRDREETRYFVTVELDVTQVERPCSVDVSVGGEHAGSLIVMAQPPSGTIHGTFAIDKALAKKGLHTSATEDVVKKIKAALDVKIVRVSWARRPNASETIANRFAVQGSDGGQIPTSTVPSLAVDLEDVKVRPPKSDDQLPKYSQPRRRPAYGHKKIRDNGCA
jgi:tyrosinase